MSSLLNKYQHVASATLEETKSLPFAVYHDKNIYKLEMEKLFHNEWVVICTERELPEVGDYYAFDLAGEAVVIVRGSDDILRALSNNCRHRGTQLLDDGFGKIDKKIVCPYHAWVYDDQGGFKGAPFSGSIVVEKSQHCLPQFHLGICLGLVFVNLSESPQSLSERMHSIEEYASVFQPERFDNALPDNTEYWNANWKLAMENAMESYHLFKVHKGTLETITPTKQSFYVAGSADWTLTSGKMIDNSSKISKWLSGDYPEVYKHYLLVSLPPSFVGIMSYDSFSWLTVMPSDSEHCTIRAGAIAPKSADDNNQEQEFTAAFFAEDKWICERVQKGMHSTRGHGGKLVEMERVVADFHQFLATRLFDTESNEFYENPESTIFDQK